MFRIQLGKYNIEYCTDVIKLVKSKYLCEIYNAQIQKGIKQLYLLTQQFKGITLKCKQCKLCKKNS